MQLISRQESVKSNLRNLTLHEFMCYEAENVVRHNWTDVAIHDQKIINKMRPGDTRLWIISEFGSQLLPLYCKLCEKQKQEESEYELSVVEIYMMRFLKNDRLGEMQSRLARATSKFYFITKGYGKYDYSVAAASFGAVLDFVFNGKANQFID